MQLERTSRLAFEQDRAVWRGSNPEHEALKSELRDYMERLRISGRSAGRVGDNSSRVVIRVALSLVVEPLVAANRLVRSVVGIK